MASQPESYLDGMDAETAALAIQLQLDDIEAYHSSFKGKGREDDGDDVSVTFRIARQELENRRTALNDKKMALSISRAVQSDRAVLANEKAIELMAAADREVARRMQISGSSTALPLLENRASGETEDIDNEHLAKLMGLFVSERDAARFLVEEGAASHGAGPSENTKVLNRRCEVCNDITKIFNVARLPCRHEYCRSCLENLFSSSMTDETLFPPRCCRQVVPLASVQIFLTNETAKLFEEKSPELSTPNRTYCHQPKCSTWIPPAKIANDIGTCPNCSQRTCVLCKGAGHSDECPTDEISQMLLNLAQESGWQRCYQCRRVVELNIGCNHMTYVVPSQFSMFFADKSSVVDAEHNSATFVENRGNVADVLSGKRVVCMLEPSRFSTEASEKRRNKDKDRDKHQCRAHKHRTASTTSPKI